MNSTVYLPPPASPLELCSHKSPYQLLQPNLPTQLELLFKIIRIPLITMDIWMGIVVY